MAESPQLRHDFGGNTQSSLQSRAQSKQALAAWVAHSNLVDQSTNSAGTAQNDGEAGAQTLHNNQTEPNLTQPSDYISITQAHNPDGTIAPTIDTIAIQANNQQRK